MAIATEGKLAVIIPELANHFFAAQIEHFAIDELEAMLFWASGGKK